MLLNINLVHLDTKNNIWIKYISINIKTLQMIFYQQEKS